jgi:hypothetical protein
LKSSFSVHLAEFLGFARLRPCRSCSTSVQPRCAPFSTDNYHRAARRSSTTTCWPPGFRSATTYHQRTASWRRDDRPLSSRCQLIPAAPDVIKLFSPNPGSRPHLVKRGAQEPQGGEWRDLPSGTTRLFLPSFGPETGARPPNHPVSPNLAQSQEIRTRFAQELPQRLRRGGCSQLTGPRVHRHERRELEGLLLDVTLWNPSRPTMAIAAHSREASHASRCRLRCVTPSREQELYHERQVRRNRRTATPVIRHLVGSKI